MQTALLIIMATLPVVVIMLYINGRDAEKEPPMLLLKLFLLGIASAFVAGLFSFGVCEAIDGAFNEGSMIHLLLTYFIGVGLIEELSKWFFSYQFGYKNKNCNEPFDPLIYCIFVALGFAFIENIMYVLDQPAFNEALMVAGMRGVAAVPGHASDAAFMGFFLMQAWKCKQKGDRAGERRNTIFSIVAPTITHALYDISCELAAFTEMIWILAVIGVYVVMIYSVKNSAKASKEWIDGQPKQFTPPQQDGVWASGSPVQPTRGHQSAPFAGAAPTHNPVEYKTTVVTPSGFVDTPATATAASSEHRKSAPRFCGECGAPAAPGHNFCPHCGTKLV